jgi:hypothetical protein
LYLEDLLRLFAIARVANPKIKLNLVPNSNGNVSFRSLQNFRGNNKPNPYYYENTFATLSFDFSYFHFLQAQTIVPLLEKTKT